MTGLRVGTAVILELSESSQSRAVGHDSIHTFSLSSIESRSMAINMINFVRAAGNLRSPRAPPILLVTVDLWTCGGSADAYHQWTASDSEGKGLLTVWAGSQRFGAPTAYSLTLKHSEFGGKF